jgi:hypothetical protein
MFRSACSTGRPPVNTDRVVRSSARPTSTSPWADDAFEQRALSELPDRDGSAFYSVHVHFQSWRYSSRRRSPPDRLLLGGGPPFRRQTASSELRNCIYSLESPFADRYYGPTRPSDGGSRARTIGSRSRKAGCSKAGRSARFACDVKSDALNSLFLRANTPIPFHLAEQTGRLVPTAALISCRADNVGCSRSSPVLQTSLRARIHSHSTSRSSWLRWYPSDRVKPGSTEGRRRVDELPSSHLEAIDENGTDSTRNRIRLGGRNRGLTLRGTTLAVPGDLAGIIFPVPRCGGGTDFCPGTFGVQNRDDSPRRAFSYTPAKHPHGKALARQPRRNVRISVLRPWDRATKFSQAMGDCAASIGR